MWISKYSLQAKDPLNSASKNRQRLGFFIKDSDFVAKDDLIQNLLQYSDFIHWPELGDPELKKLKPFLMDSSQNELKFKFALTQKDLVPVKSNAIVNHFSSLLGEELEKFSEAGFEVIKFKMGFDFEKEFKELMRMNLSGFLLRVDLNCKFNFKESKEILEMLKKIPNLEYAEDPSPYHDYYWSELQKIAPLALDNLAASAETKPPKHFQYRIVKPMRELSVEELVKMTYDKKKIVLTNMMDNAVGAWKLYFYYCELKKQIPYHLCTPGFHTHSLFEDYNWAHLLAFKGALWSYDDQTLQSLLVALSKLTWLKLNYLDSKALDSIIQDSEPYR